MLRSPQKGDEICIDANRESRYYKNTFSFHRLVRFQKKYPSKSPKRAKN